MKVRVAIVTVLMLVSTLVGSSAIPVGAEEVSRSGRRVHHRHWQYCNVGATDLANFGRFAAEARTWTYSAVGRQCDDPNKNPMDLSGAPYDHVRAQVWLVTEDWAVCWGPNWTAINGHGSAEARMFSDVISSCGYGYRAATGAHTVRYDGVYQPGCCNSEEAWVYFQ